MRRNRHLIVVACLAAFVSAGMPRSAWPCGFCYNLGGNPFALPHPRAIEIAMATRAAIDQGVLSDRPSISRETLLDGGNGVVSLKKVTAASLVEAWATRLDRSALPDRPVAIHFLFVDTEQRCGLLLRGGVVLFDNRPSFVADMHVITTRNTFHALTSNGLSFTEAQRLGLVILEGDSQASESLLPGKR